MNLSYDDWQNFKETGKFERDCELNREDIVRWYSEQVEKRIGSEIVFPYYCFVEKPLGKWYAPPKRVVLKIRVDPSKVVMFDDDDYVHVLNCLYNNKHMYLAWNEAEYNEKEHCSTEECIESYPRMFDLDPRKRCAKWSGPVNPRAFIPNVTRDMVRKVWVYSWGRRLRKPRRKI